MLRSLTHESIIESIKIWMIFNYLKTVIIDTFDLKHWTRREDVEEFNALVHHRVYQILDDF